MIRLKAHFLNLDLLCHGFIECMLFSGLASGFNRIPINLCLVLDAFVNTTQEYKLQNREIEESDQVVI